MIPIGQPTHQDSKNSRLRRINSCLRCTKILPAVQTHPHAPHQRFVSECSRRFEPKAFKNSVCLFRREAILLTTPQWTVGVTMTVEIKPKKNRVSLQRVYV